MTWLLPLVPAFVSGIAMGLLYFGGLWLTVQRLATSRMPALVMAGSFVVRTGLAVAGFYLVMDGRWERAVACLAGFVLARLWLARRLGAERIAAVPRETTGR